MILFHIFKAYSNMSRNFGARKCAPIDAHAKTKPFLYLHRPHNFKTHASMTMQSFAKIFKNGNPPALLNHLEHSTIIVLPLDQF